jgi:hypothetical protein
VNPVLTLRRFPEGAKVILKDIFVFFLLSEAQYVAGTYTEHTYTR